MFFLSVSVACLAATGCDGSPSGGPDGGAAVDSGSRRDADLRDGGAADSGAADSGAADSGASVDGGITADGGPATDDTRPPRLVELRTDDDGATILMVFDQPVSGTNMGFTIYNTTDTAFESVSGFGTTALRGALAHPVVYGEPVNVSYLDIETKGLITGDLRGGPGNFVRYFLKERVDTSELVHRGSERYVSAGATGGGDGSEASPFTLQEMVEDLTAGTRYNVEAGDYGSVSLLINNIQGAPGRPIIIEGYRSRPGDSPDLGWEYGVNTDMDSALMPLLDGGESTSRGITFTADSAYITIRNFQIRDYPGTLLYSNNCHNLWFDNVIVENGDRGIQSVGAIERAYHNAVTNCVAYNGWRQNFVVTGDATLVQDNTSYCDYTGDPTDYYYSLSGNNNVLRDNYAQRVGDLSHFGHALSIHTPWPVATDEPDPGEVQYNFVDGHTSVNIVKAVELRHGGVRYNVVRGVESYGEGPGSDAASGVMFRDNTSFNIVEDAFIHGVNVGVYFVESAEIGVGLGHDNLVRNSLFVDLDQGVYIDNVNTDGADGFNNRLYNNTFYNSATLFRVRADFTHVMNSEFGSNIVVGSTRLTTGFAFEGWSFLNNAFWDTDPDAFPVPTGMGNVAVDPGFVDAPAGDLHLGADSPDVVQNGGADHAEVQWDREGRHRRMGRHSIGAYEYDE